MHLHDIRTAIEEYATSAQLAMQAGFYGVELHAANGYLIEQFLNPNVNLRTDEYGTSNTARNRFALEVVNAVSAETALQANQADLIAFGRQFLANPDLVNRMQRGAAQNVPDMATFYTPGAKGYTDYPALAV